MKGVKKDHSSFFKKNHLGYCELITFKKNLILKLIVEIKEVVIIEMSYFKVCIKVLT